MHRVYYITKTTYTDTTTGEQLRDPVYTYTPLPASRWYKGDPTWTLALRLGGKVMIPIDGFMSTSITIGGGYIYLPFQHNHSTWDVALGICSYF